MKTNPLRVMQDRQAQAVIGNHSERDSMSALLFGKPGDWFDRHQGLTLAIVGLLVIVGGSV